MKNIFKVVFYLWFTGSSLVLAQTHENFFSQEYHKPYPLVTKDQNDVRSIVVDLAEGVWAGTKAGLFWLNQSTGNWQSMLNDNDQGPVYDLFVDQKGRVWVAAWNGVFVVDDAKIEKIKGVKGPVGVISEINGSIVAMGPEGIWKNNGKNWIKQKLNTSKAFRKLIPEGKDGFYLATGKGLYHQNKGKITLFQSNKEVLSDDVYGMDFDKNGDLWVGSQGGISVFKKDQWIKSYTPKNGLPSIWVNSVKRSPGGVMWVGTRLGVTRFDGKSWSLRHSRRWLLNDDVRDIAFDKNGNAWIATAAGVSAVMKKQMTLEQKASYYYSIMKNRHIRDPYLVEKCRFNIPGDTIQYEPNDDDNDGQYTSMYLAMESYRYAVTKDPEAKKRAEKAFSALEFLETVTGIEGFVARTVIPKDWKRMADANRTISDREWADKLMNEPRETRIEKMWLPSKDGKWLWKRGTSSDEITGHMYGYLIYYDLVAKGKEKERVKNHILKIVDYIIDGGYKLIDIDGKHTKWGVWDPEYLNKDPDWITERSINSLEILSYLKLAYHVSGDEKYQKEFYKLFDKYHYRDYIVEAKTVHNSWITYIDDELLALAYPVLVEYETDPEVKKIIRQSVDQWYNALKYDDNPYFYFLYDGFTNQKLNVERSVFLLEDNPLDLIRWKVDNSKREDLQIVRKPVLEDLQTSRLVPPSERGIMRWDNNPWRAVQGDGGYTESDGVYWMLAYWTGRYYKLID